MIALHNNAYVQVGGALSRLVMIEQIAYGRKLGGIRLGNKGQKL